MAIGSAIADDLFDASRLTNRNNHFDTFIGRSQAPRDDAATAQYFRITPTTTPWIRTSRSWTRKGCMVALAGWRRIFPPGSR